MIASKLDLTNIPQEAIQLLERTTSINDKSKSFIQTGDLPQIIKLTKKIALKAKTLDEISEMFHCSKRMAMNYVTGCIYLGVVIEKKDKNGVSVFYPTKTGREVAVLKYSDKKLALKIFELACKNKLFLTLFREVIYKQRFPEVSRIKELLILYDVCCVTLSPGQSTPDMLLDSKVGIVRQWLYYILDSLISDSRRLKSNRSDSLQGEGPKFFVKTSAAGEKKVG